MGVRRFITLIAIAELGTFAEAAKAVFLTPAAVSQQMKSLESEFGISLFDRNKRPPELNPAGYALVSKARELVRMYREIKPSLSGNVNTIENITVGTVSTTMTGIMPRALQGLHKNYGSLHVRVYPGLSDELYAQVDRGFLDAAIITEPLTVYDHLVWRPFTQEPFVVLASPETTSDDPKVILESQPYIRFARRAWVGRMIDEWLRENRVKVIETMEVETLESASAMVANNLGVSIVPMNCCAWPEETRLREIPLGASMKPRVLGVLWRRDVATHKLIDILWKELLNAVVAAGRTQPLFNPGG